MKFISVPLAPTFKLSIEHIEDFKESIEPTVTIMVSKSSNLKYLRVVLISPSGSNIDREVY